MIKLYDAARDSEEILAQLSARRQEANADALQTVRNILSDVRARGDAALIEHTRRFDWPAAQADTIMVTRDEIMAAYAAVGAGLLQALRQSAKNIAAFHERQKREGFMDGPAGRRVGQLVRPLERVGVYVPGGHAAYPSSVLMNIIPARVAGVEQIVMTTPADGNGHIDALTLVAANEAGASEIYRVGGAQAIAALAYGTECIARVDKIVGPGNLYVALAKREVFGEVGIDMIAGPSEILVMADAFADPDFVAADMLSQAEHDPLSAAFLVTDSRKLAEAVQKRLYAQLEQLPRRRIARQSIEDQGGIIIADNLMDAMDLVNAIAPEHLELMVERPGVLLGKVKNAGSIFLGYYSPEALGDYYAGPNHVLPTGGTARFASPLSVDDFIKKMGLIFYSQEELEKASAQIAEFANAEGLGAHANSVSIRFSK